ncbi:Diacylglycerol kinase [Candidatus Syntrophocurvum alkaliphilum]|uniref:Diacylglycerol kinase n=1 Tax=Candidatus Syntrophocurvum alkaliphilum TaxID=2293317 RepID=A0A6I6DIF0_9FIRM|nr:diacylglycerol kinase family protein [Candidatus Syntrophocurvum alkaliphilum]QGT99983.1 Diacylglycerol kinase [Candidatus Syntrophocurvum alkaliphilum]
MGKRSLKQRFSDAFSGLLYTIVSQRNMKIHLLVAIVVVFFALFLGVSKIEWGILILTIFIVLIAETINTSLEKTVDLITNKYHPLAGLVKNIAAGAVLLAAINAVIIGFIIFIPYILK